MSEVDPQHPEGRDWKRHPWRALPTWGKWVVGVLGVLIVMGVGAAIAGNGEEGKLKDQIASLERKLKRSESERRSAEYQYDTLKDEEAEVISDAEAKAEKIVGGAKDELSSVSSELSKKEGALESTEGELASTEGALSGAQEEKRLSTIPGNGTFQSEVDYLPGTYKSEGGPTCYWATLNSANPYDIASNENARGPTIASITSPYFQTNGCATWHRVGE